MTIPPQEKNRRVIPRWRDFQTTLLQGELAPLSSPSEPLTLDPSFFLEKQDDWHRNKSLVYAADLLGAAIVYGQQSEVQDAAEFVLAAGDTVPAPVRELALRALDKVSEPASALSSDPTTMMKQRVRLLRASLRVDPRNALAWADMSHAYATLGQTTQAIESMDRALQLAPNSRFILRAASRLHVHVGDVERSLAILRRSPALRHDPWLLAAEISVSSLSEMTSPFVKHGQRLIASDRLGAFHVAELKSAIGTLELASGKVRGARKLFMGSLEQPTDNTVAQAEWVARERKLFEFDRRTLDVPRTFEARARDSFVRGMWEPAMNDIKNWMLDEPYSAQPVIFGSYVASTALRNDKAAIEVLEVGHRANPNNVIILNNLAFSYANLNDLTKAEGCLAKALAHEGDAWVTATLRATAGLIAFRRQNFQSARVLYDEAIAGLAAIGGPKGVAIAAIMLAREEVLARTDHATAAVERAEAASAKVADLEVKDWVSWLRTNVRRTR